jgi:hypothetical protein
VSVSEQALSLIEPTDFAYVDIAALATQRLPMPTRRRTGSIQRVLRHQCEIQIDYSRFVCLDGRETQRSDQRDERRSHPDPLPSSLGLFCMAFAGAAFVWRQRRQECAADQRFVPAI